MIIFLKMMESSFSASQLISLLNVPLDVSQLCNSSNWLQLLITFIESSFDLPLDVFTLKNIWPIFSRYYSFIASNLNNLLGWLYIINYKSMIWFIIQIFWMSLICIFFFFFLLTYIKRNILMTIQIMLSQIMKINYMNYIRMNTRSHLLKHLIANQEENQKNWIYLKCSLNISLIEIITWIINVVH